MARFVSNTGAPVVEFGDWCAAKNSPAIDNLFNLHKTLVVENRFLEPGEQPSLQALYAQFLSETNQSVVHD